jgi:hypothetical protein
MSYRFETHHHGNNDRLGLAAKLAAFLDRQWLAIRTDHCQAAAAMPDRFTKLIQHDKKE